MIYQDKLEALVALCEAMAWAPSPDDAYQRVVDVTSVYFECDEAHLHLLDFEGESFVRRAHHGNESSIGFRKDAYSADLGRSRYLLNTGSIIVMADYANPDPRDVIPPEAVEMGFKSAVSIPLAASQSVFGMLSLTYKRPLPWTEEDYPFLVDVGRVMGVMIRRIQATKKDLELEMLRERRRLSGEIHDNLSQMVSTLAMRADTALMCYEEGDHEAVRTELENLGAVSRSVTKILRDEMLSLRTPMKGSQDMAESVREQLERFQAQWGIRTELSLLSGNSYEVSAHTALQFTCILNESLSNVLRHAQATCVKVQLKANASRLEAVIEDDGKGFDTARVSPERLGIRIMQERAAAARGRVRIDSGPGGTTVAVVLERGQG